MTITKEIKKELKSWGYVVESESPLKLVPIIEPGAANNANANEVLIGIPAMLIVKDAMQDQNGGELNLSELDSMDNDAYLLVTANVNYADEFDMSEWTTMSVGDFRELANSLKEYEDEISWYFGSNEEMQFSDGNDLLSQLTFRVLTTEEYDVLDSLFGGGFDGGAGVFSHISELDSEQDRENDEEAEEMVGILDSSELKKIEKLKLFGWAIEVYDEDEYLLEYKNTNGDYAITHTGVIDDLVEYHKRNK